MQNAYAVLDRYKISRTFFLKTNQADCTVLPEPAAASELDGKNADEPVPEEVPAEKAKEVEQPVEVREYLREYSLLCCFLSQYI